MVEPQLLLQIAGRCPVRNFWFVLMLPTVLLGCYTSRIHDRPDVPSFNSSAATETFSYNEGNMTQPPAHQQRPDPTEAMRQLRQTMLSTNPTQFGILATEEFPSVYGVLAEFQIGGATATVVSLCDGNASLYTTSTFGIIGGHAHEAVRTAAIGFVKQMQAYHDDATNTAEFPYPKSDRVRFYLLTYSGVRYIDTDLKSIAAGNNKYSDLFESANKVLSELRLTTEQ